MCFINVGVIIYKKTFYLKLKTDQGELIKKIIKL